MPSKATKLSVSVPTELYDRAIRLLGKPDSALITRLLKGAVRDAQDAAIDAEYDKAIAAHPEYVSPEALKRTSAMARAAHASAHASQGLDQRLGQRD